MTTREIGRFDLTDIPPSPRGLPQIEVAFDIDADGILHVSAKDMSSGKEQKIRIEAQSGLREDDIKRMLRDAEVHADEDKKRKEEVEVRNEADSLVFRATKALSEYKDKLPKDVVDDVQSKIDDVKKALEGSDIGRIKPLNRTSKSICNISAKRWLKQVLAVALVPRPMQALGQLMNNPVLVSAAVHMNSPDSSNSQVARAAMTTSKKPM